MNPTAPSPFSLSETWWRGIILALSLTVLLFSIWCLTQGITTIFMHLYYFPIVLLAYHYRWKGFGLATLLALAYLGLVIVFNPGQSDVILGAFYRFLVFVGIAAVIAYLSDRLAQARSTMQQSAELRDRYLSLAPAIVLALDRDGAITFLSKHGGEILECIQDDAIGKLWIEQFLPEKERERVKKIFSQLMAGQIEQNRIVENLVMTCGGVEKIIRWHNTVLHDEKGEISGILGFGEDITEEKWRQDTLNKMQQFQESVITNANVWISVLEPDGTLLVWNDAAEAISGYKKTGVLGKRTVWKQLYPDNEYRKKVTGDIQRIISRDTFLENFETEIRCADGTKKIIVWNTRGQRDTKGAITSYIAIGRDVTSQKSAEDALVLEKQRMESLLLLNQKSQMADTEIISDIVEDAIRLTGSTIGYLATMNDDESVMTMQYWSKSAHVSCSVIDKPIVYRLEKTGLWGEAVRQRKPIITNDYAAESPLKRGIPDGHVPLVRHMNIPVFEGERIVAVAGVGNKGADYNDGDVSQLQLLLQGWWQIAVRKRAEEEIKRSVERFRMVMDSIDALVYVADMQTYELLFMNKYGRDIWGEGVEGKVCWQIIQSGQKGPCPFCTNARLVDEKGNPTGIYNWEFQNTVNGHWYDCRDSAIRWLDGRLVRLEIATDITGRKHIEVALNESRQLFSDIISFLPDPTFVIDKDGNVLAWNRALEQLSGVFAGDIIGKGDHEYSLWQYEKRRPVLIDLVLHPDQDAGRMDYKGIHWDGRTVTAQTEIIRPGSGHTISLSLVASPLIDLQGKITGAIESMRDISRLKEVEAELERINQNLEQIVRDRTRLLQDEVAQRMRAEKDVQDALSYTRSVIEANPDLMVVLDRNGTVLDINAAAESLTGIPREQLIGTLYFSYLLDDGTLHNAFSKLLETGRLENIIQIRRTDGHVTPLSVNATMIGKKDAPDVRIIVSAHDITRQKKDEEVIRASLDEKVILLREVHHRVKNNLQIIISLVNLQMRQTDDPEVKQIMSETQNRVRAMSLVHEKLYRSESLSRIDFADYTRYLATQLLSFYGSGTQRVRLDFVMEKIMVDINTAVPLGLLMNELISNALKHAFPNDREGTISISGGYEGNLITLVVRDNGIGIPADFDWKNTTSLGMRLVTSLIDQVDGTIVLDRSEGTTFTITIKREPASGETG
jgi:PAS domain S-box-containing protein